MRSIVRIRFAMLSMLVVLLGCAGDRVGRIADEYGYGEPQASLEPMVIVTGFLGSNLVDRESGHEVWGLFLAGEQRVWRADVQRRIALPMTGGETLAEMRDQVVADGVMQNGEIQIAGQRFTVNTYPGLLWGILRGLGEPGSAGDTPSKRELRSATRAAESDSTPRIHGVAFDWRRDLSESAEALDVAVRAAHREKLELGLEGDAARVDIIAHSMGTLVTRYYLRYGTQTLEPDGSLPVLDWRGAQLVRRVVLVAPPNNGSLEALRDVTQGGSPEFPIPSHPPALLATFVSLYQSLCGRRIARGLLRCRDLGSPGLGTARKRPAGGASESAAPPPDGRGAPGCGARLRCALPRACRAAERGARYSLTASGGHHDAPLSRRHDRHTRPGRGGPPQR
ncbi:MAG: hypothetical protein JRH17_25455 [Deltaproteobacteria bacterium]|nr:hypothetical protein [Deltaproteobacteria bacterium]